VKQKNKDITDSIRYAQYIQEAILPPPERIANAFSDSFVLYLPKDIISGDFYWFKEIEHIKMLSVADCTGHGVPGAFLSIMGNELLSFFVDSFKILDPPHLLKRIDQRITQSLNQEESRRADGMDMILISYNSKDGMLCYSGAYRPLIMIRNDELTVLKPSRHSLGGYDSTKAKSFTSNEFKAYPGDCYYMFSDGYPDQFGGQKRKKFMSRRFYNLLRDIHSMPMDQQKERLLQAHLKWKGSEEQVDDIIIVGIRI
jgi:serine phosphatase RsbU (regulator of sigma subunit)